MYYLLYRFCVSIFMYLYIERENRLQEGIDHVTACPAITVLEVPALPFI